MLPIEKLKQCFHIGTLQGKPWPSFSHEGPLLSCSLHPDEWRSIAQLGNAPTWTIQRTPHLRLLNIHKLRRSLRQQWLHIAAAQQLIQTTKIFQIVVSTDEEGNEQISWFDNKTEAIRERLDEDQTPTTKTGWKALPKLNQYWTGNPRTNVHLLSAEDAAITFLAEQDSNLDGIWWNDNYDPTALSCPRGGIFPQRIKAFNRVTQQIEIF